MRYDADRQCMHYTQNFMQFFFQFSFSHSILSYTRTISRVRILVYICAGLQLTRANTSVYVRTRAWENHNIDWVYKHQESISDFNIELFLLSLGFCLSIKKFKDKKQIHCISWLISKTANRSICKLNARIYEIRQRQQKKTPKRNHWNEMNSRHNGREIGISRNDWMWINRFDVTENWMANYFRFDNRYYFSLINCSRYIALNKQSTTISCDHCGTLMI